jgi:hypothetical protein
MAHPEDNQLDWSAAATPEGERVVPSLWRQPKPRTPPQSKSGVMDTLLGKNDLTASAVDGSDPYNATGRHFLR